MILSEFVPSCFQLVHPSPAPKNDEEDGKADAFLHGQSEINHGDGPVKHKSREKPQRYAEQPCAHQVDGHDVGRFSAAAQDAASDDHVQHLKRHNCGVGGEDLDRQLPYAGFHVENTHIPRAYKENHP